MAERNIIAKMFETSTIFFVGIPFMVIFGTIMYSIGLGPKKQLNKRYVTALLTFCFACLVTHVMNDLDKDDVDSIQMAGWIGYAMVAVVLVAFLAMSYLTLKRQPGRV